MLLTRPDQHRGTGTCRRDPTTKTCEFDDQVHATGILYNDVRMLPGVCRISTQIPWPRSVFNARRDTNEKYSRPGNDRKNITSATMQNDTTALPPTMFWLSSIYEQVAKGQKTKDVWGSLSRPSEMVFLAESLGFAPRRSFVSRKMTPLGGVSQRHEACYFIFAFFLAASGRYQRGSIL